jgi:hypothetical protein
MEKRIYITLFVFLGILLQFLIHAFLEIWYIDLLTFDFQKYSLGFSWSQWVFIHHIGSFILLLLGILFGFWQGRFWWNKIYVKKSKCR